MTPEEYASRLVDRNENPQLWNLAVKCFRATHREAYERAARVAEGEVYHERYRTWPFWPVNETGGRGNRDRDDELVKHCDRIAAAIRALGEEK